MIGETGFEGEPRALPCPPSSIAHMFEQTDIAPVRVQGRFWSGSK
jgi:hypothetical protein